MLRQLNQDNRDFTLRNLDLNLNDRNNHAYISNDARLGLGVKRINLETVRGEETTMDLGILLRALGTAGSTYTLSIPLQGAANFYPSVSMTPFIENKAQWLAAVSKRPYVSRDVDSQQLELHGDVAITYGRYRARTTAADPARNSFTVWYERVHARRNGGWQYLSHRTVRGPIYEQRGKSPQ